MRRSRNDDRCALVVAAVSRAVLVVTLLAGAACPPSSQRKPIQTPTGASYSRLPAAPCEFDEMGVIVPGVGGDAPAVAISSGRVALAWLEADGAHEDIHVGVVDPTVEKELRALTSTAETAVGWTSLRDPRLTAADAGFVLGLTGGSPEGKSGIATAQVGLDGRVTSPTMQLEAASPHLIALARLGDRLLVGWESEESGVRQLRLSSVGPGAPLPPTPLGIAEAHPEIVLAAARDEAHAAWTSSDRQQFYLSVSWQRFDAMANPIGQRVRLDDGHEPSIALARSGPIVAFERQHEHGSWIGRPGEPGRVSMNREAVVAGAGAGAVLCEDVDEHYVTPEKRELRCLRLDGDGRPVDEFRLPARAVDAKTLSIAVEGKLVAIAWQHRDIVSGIAVTLAVARCQNELR